MKTIHKYTIDKWNPHCFLPEGAEVLKVDLQGSGQQLCLWALVDPRKPADVMRKFPLYGTGHEIVDPESLTYIGTVFPNDLVFHVFERT